MTISNVGLTLHFYDTYLTSAGPATPSVDFMSDPFYVEDGGVDISEPQKTISISESVGHNVLSSRGGIYNDRTVDVTVGIKDYENSSVRDLFKYANTIDYLSSFVNHPLAALEVNLGTESTSGSQYRGYLKVLSIDISPTSDLYNIGPTYNQSDLGKRYRISFTCDPFFYKYNPVDNQYESLNIFYPNNTGTGWLQDTVATITPSNYPCFYVKPTDIEGDVATPLIVRVANSSGNSGSVGDVYIGTNLVKSYPDIVTTDFPGNNQFWEFYWNSAGENLRTISDVSNINAILDYKLAGKVYSILIRTSGPTKNIEQGSYTVGIYYQSVSQVDINTITVVGNETMGELGIYFIPNPAGQSTDVYRTRIIEKPDLAVEDDYEIITIPAWGFRKYTPKGYNLTPGNTLVDNPYNNTVYVSNGGVYYHGEGSGLYAVPSIGMRGAFIVKRALIGENLFDEPLKLRLTYNPRYLNIRNIIT